MTLAYVALGSNLQCPEAQLRTAVAALAMTPDIELLRASSIYRSAAVGPGQQPDYLNAVVLLTTTLPVMTLLDTLQQIEQDQGRIRDIHWGPRTLDLDLLLYGDLQITSPRLTLPHPRMHQRNFVLYPLHEISDINLSLPDGTDLGALLQQCPEDGLVKTPIQLRINHSPQGE
jgi:2-amino-4-hydroxy-6-hydroxymethyldihydropteridine diphosphokinase